MTAYEPREDSYLLQKFVGEYAQGRVLDPGTGSGIQALTAIKNPSVKEVVAVDVRKRAINQLNKIIGERKLRKIKAFQSDLFKKVEGQFNVIIFNPPYLPQDKGIRDRAIYGGKKGWEISERFLKEVSNYLFPDGKILFLFSSLTNRNKINEILAENLLQWKELGRQKLAFEELYVYEITKAVLLRELEKKGVEKISYFARGRRGTIFIGLLDQNKLVKTHLSTSKKIVKVAIKIKKRESKAEGRIKNEAKWLRLLNRKRIGPKLLFSGNNYLVYEFIEGKFILDWLKGKSKKEIKEVLIKILKQCFIMDQMNVNKEEMHHPLKHILIKSNGTPVLIDFERCRRTNKPRNVTQFVEFIRRMRKELKKKKIEISRGKLIELARSYKKNPNKITFNRILAEF